MIAKMKPAPFAAGPASQLDHAGGLIDCKIAKRIGNFKKFS
jgi:hypothetical protein